MNNFYSSISFLLVRISIIWSIIISGILNRPPRALLEQQKSKLNRDIRLVFYKEFVMFPMDAQSRLSFLRGPNLFTLDIAPYSHEIYFVKEYFDSNLRMNESNFLSIRFLTLLETLCWLLGFYLGPTSATTAKAKLIHVGCKLLRAWFKGGILCLHI